MALFCIELICSAFSAFSYISIKGHCIEYVGSSMMGALHITVTDCDFHLPFYINFECPEQRFKISVENLMQKISYKLPSIFVIFELFQDNVFVSK